eukprot:jgi/Psemu1/53037/gm1.53037_g
MPTIVPPPDAYDCWSNVYGIVLRFHSKSNPQAATSLNNSYSETVQVSAPEMFTLFTSDEDGLKVLGLAPATALREITCNIIALDIENLDKIAEGYIAQLINVCPMKFVKPGLSNQRIRTLNDFESTGREAVEQGEEANKQEAIAITGDVQPNDTGNNNDDDNGGATGTQSRATATEMKRLENLLQQMVNNGTSDNNNVSHNPDTPALPWNPTALSATVKERCNRSEDFLTSKEQTYFEIKSTDATGNKVISHQNYYIFNLGSGRGDQRLITRSGDCFDLTRASDKSREAAQDKLFLSGFPQLKNETAPQVRKWYQKVIYHSQQHHIYVHPYCLYRREDDHLRGFTIANFDLKSITQATAAIPDHNDKHIIGSS